MAKIILNDQILRNSKSVCPDCFKEIDSVIIERAGQIFIIKECSEHGHFEAKVSHDAKYYRDRLDYFTTLVSDNMPITRKLLYVSSECNLDCPICYYRLNKENAPQALSFEEIEKMADTNFELRIFGKEPVCRPDILDVIKMMKRKKKEIVLHSNGVRLSNYEFLENLKNCGVSKIIMQFDGFAERVQAPIRGQDNLKDIKLKALDNMRKLGLSLIINDTVVEGVNESSMKELIDYSLSNDFIAGILFLGYGGWGKYAEPEKLVNVEQMLEILEKQTDGKIKKRNVFIFQKLLCIYLSVVKVTTCMQVQNYWIYRKGDEYFPIDEVLDMERLDKYLTSCLGKYFKKGRKKLGLLYALWGVIRSFKNFKLISLMFIDGVKVLMHSRSKNRFLNLNFISPCDHYKLDDLVLKYCDTDIVYKDGKGEMISTPHSQALINLWRSEVLMDVNSCSKE